MAALPGIEKRERKAACRGVSGGVQEVRFPEKLSDRQAGIIGKTFIPTAFRFADAILLIICVLILLFILNRISGKGISQPYKRSGERKKQRFKLPST